jgi:histone H3/H4
MGRTQKAADLKKQLAARTLNAQKKQVAPPRADLSRVASTQQSESRGANHLTRNKIKTMRAIRKQQLNVGFVMRKGPFRRYFKQRVSDRLASNASELTWSSDAMLQLQYSAEKKLCDEMERSKEMAAHCKRIKVTAADHRVGNLIAHDGLYAFRDLRVALPQPKPRQRKSTPKVATSTAAAATH